jgi:hypothetical protein
MEPCQQTRSAMPITISAQKGSGAASRVLGSFRMVEDPAAAHLHATRQWRLQCPRSAFRVAVRGKQFGSGIRAGHMLRGDAGAGVFAAEEGDLDVLGET